MKHPVNPLSNLNLSYKLILSSLSIIVLIGVVAYISSHESQNMLKKSIGESSVILAEGILGSIDKDIFHYIEDFQAYSKDLTLQEALVKSNQEFEKLENMQDYINKQDQEWISVPKEKITPFMKELMNNQSSADLKEKIEFYEEKYGYNFFAEVFTTNKYGANASQTGKTADYRQDDEEWWQKAKAEGLYVADVEYDKSAEVYSITISIRINDEDGNFAGVMKVVLNIDEVINILKALELETSGSDTNHKDQRHKNYNTMEFKLLTKEGKIIYSTKDYEFLGDFSEEVFTRFGRIKDPAHIDYFVGDSDMPGEGEKLFAHSHSTGYRDFKGLGWSLVIEYKTDDIFAPIIRLRKHLFILSIAMTILATIMSFLIYISIAKPIKKLRDTAIEIGKGHLDAQIVVESNDEIGQLAASFQQMTNNLKTVNERLIEDIVKRKQTEKQLEHQAFYDQLTNLPNRSKFLKHLERMLKHVQRHNDYLFAVLFIDLDRFKIVNDSLGHIMGDKLLVEVARQLETCIRPNDRIARFGGDEFAIFLHDIKDESSALRVANRIHLILNTPFNLDGHEIFTSASIGITLSSTGYENQEDILRDADSAMYRAKGLGRACSEIFDSEMHAHVSKILRLESDLKKALERKEFMLYYQPIVSATDGLITGAEALLRWKHPQYGFISPMDFIPIAEETGLITTIGEWILRTACRQHKEWQDAGYQHLLMKVNFSLRQFNDKNLTELVKRILKETNMPAQLLDVEITESIAMADNAIEILNQLTAMGIQTSLDDFGTGYSSLGSLTHFPINTIKIDRAFIKDFTIDINAKAIIKAIIAMAHSLNMEVVAEGVETEDQLAFLQSQECDKMQGYLFSPPVPEEDFRKLLEKEKNGSPIIQKHSALIV